MTDEINTTKDTKETNNTDAIKIGVNKVIMWCIISVIVIIAIIVVLIIILKKKNTNKK